MSAPELKRVSSAIRAVPTATVLAGVILAVCAASVQGGPMASGSQAGAEIRAQRERSRAAFPEGPGVETVRAQCLTCHEADLITQQRLSATGWDREVAKMERWGAAVPASERDTLVGYLARTFRPRGSAPNAHSSQEAQAADEAVLTRACSSCHERDLIESQRLSVAGWTRELEKMVRWGAVLSDAEKASLATYLAARYAPR